MADFSITIISSVCSSSPSSEDNYKIGDCDGLKHDIIEDGSKHDVIEDGLKGDVTNDASGSINKSNVSGGMRKMMKIV